MLTSTWFLLSSYFVGVFVVIFGAGFESGDPQEWKHTPQKEFWTFIGICFAWPVLLVLSLVMGMVTSVVTVFKHGCNTVFRAGALCRQRMKKAFQVMHHEHLTRE